MPSQRDCLCQNRVCNKCIAQQVKDGTIWLNHKMSNSPSDGHCLLYSIITSANSQLPATYCTNIEKIKALMRNELQLNLENYMPFTVEMTGNDLIKELDNYIERKIFNSTIGDLAPKIIANALNVGLLIVEQNKINNTSNVTDISSNDNGNNKWVLVHKEGMHYNGIIGRHNKSIANKLRLCLWNIQSLSEKKLGEVCIVKSLNECDIIMLTETWLDSSKSVNLEGFTFKSFPRLQKHSKAFRNSGGIGIYIREHLSAGVEYIYSYDD